MILLPLSLLLLSLAPSPRPASAEELPWFQGPHMSALGKARQEQRGLALYFWMEGSALCNQMYTETLQDPAVVATLQESVCVGVNIGNSNGAQLVQRYGVTTLPTLLFLTAEGEREEAVIGFINGPSLVAELGRIAAGTGTVSDFRQRVAAAPENLKLQLDLALKLRDVGDQKAHDELIAAIRAKDPQGKTVTGARLLFWEVRTTALATGSPADVDLKPVYNIAETLKPPTVRFEAWDWLATFELGRGALAASRAAAQTAWKNTSTQNQLEFGTRTTRNFWGMREELSARETAFLLGMTRTTLQLARDTLTTSDAPIPANAEGDESPANRLAQAIDAASMAEFLGGKKARAIQLIQEAIQLSPQNEEFAQRLSLYGR